MKNILISALVALIVSGLAVYFIGHKGTAAQKETVYARVMRTGVLRCGYNVEAPMVVIDPNSGHVGGAGAEIAERVAALLNLKLEWTEQVGWDQMAAGLQYDRYDLVCNGKWVLAPQARGGQFTRPLYFTAVHAYGRPNENRFGPKLEKLDDPAYTITSMDGEVNYYIARDLFPHAKRLEFPSLTDNSQLIEAVLDRKADVTFMAGFIANDYLERHPGQLKQLTAEPVALFDTAFMFKTGEAEFAGVLDAAIRQLQAAGTIKAILDRYGISENDAKRVVLPIRESAAPAALMKEVAPEGAVHAP